MVLGHPHVAMCQSKKRKCLYTFRQCCIIQERGNEPVMGLHMLIIIVDGYIVYATILLANCTAGCGWLHWLIVLLYDSHWQNAFIMQCGFVRLQCIYKYYVPVRWVFVPLNV